MATKTINDYPAKTPVASTDEILIQETAGGSYKTVTRDVLVGTSAIAVLGQTISNPPTQAEVQALSDKVDALINALNLS